MIKMCRVNNAFIFQNRIRSFNNPDYIIDVISLFSIYVLKVTVISLSSNEAGFFSVTIFSCNDLKIVSAFFQQLTSAVFLVIKATWTGDESSLILSDIIFEPTREAPISARPEAYASGYLLLGSYT